MQSQFHFLLPRTNILASRREAIMHGTTDNKRGLRAAMRWRIQAESSTTRRVTHVIATTSNGQNAVTAAKPSPVAVISSAAPSNKVCAGQR